MLLTNLLKQFLKSTNIVKEWEKIILTNNWSILKKNNNVNQVTFVNCQICGKLIENDDEKVRDHCQITEKFRHAAHESCNINRCLTKEVPVIFHKLRGYDSHLLFHEPEQFNVKIDVINAKKIRKILFILNKNLVFIDSMPFLNSSVEKKVTNLLGDDFKYSINFFCGLVDPPRPFPAGATVRDPHHWESPTRREQGLNLPITWVKA